MPDSGRAELPLKANSDERYPVGMGLALCSNRKLPLEENNFMEFSMPILFVLGEDGLLCGYYVVNMLPNTVQVTKPMNPTMENIRNGTIVVPQAPKAPSPKPETVAPSFGQSFVASTPIKPGNAIKPQAEVKAPIPPQTLETFAKPPQPVAEIQAKPSLPKAPVTIASGEPTPKIVQKSESGEIRDSFQKVWL